MIGEKFRIIREAKGLTLREVEKDTTISNAYLSQLETGKIKHPSYKVVKQLTEYYGIKLDFIEPEGLMALISMMTDIEIDNLTTYAEFLLKNRK